MLGLSLVFVAAGVAAALLTFVVRSVAVRWGVVDRPDGRRKLHHGEKPLWGGVAVYAAFLIGLCVATCRSYGIDEKYSQLSRALVLAAGLVCLVGCLDDAFRLRARFKLALQIVSVLPIVLAGYYVENVVVLGYRIEFGTLGVPLTVLWLIGCINALNLIDGMDGLASLVGLFTACMTAMIAANTGHAHVTVIAIALAGSLAGFFTHNRPPARIFLGDSGSMIIGLTLGVLGIQGSLKATATLSLTAPVIVMALPMFDTVAAVIRRKLTGRRFDAADRQHIHHRLLDLGLTPWQVLCILGAFCMTTGAAAAAATFFRIEAVAWITALVLIVAMVRAKLFGHYEVELVRQAISNSVSYAIASVRRTLRGSSATGKKLSLSDEWDSLIRKIRVWEVRRIELKMSSGPISGNRIWVDPAAQDGKPCRWSIAVSVQDRDGRCCEINADGVQKPENEKDVAYAESLLKSFSLQVFRHIEDIDVLPLMEEIRLNPIVVPISEAAKSKPIRKAA